MHGRKPQTVPLTAARAKIHFSRRIRRGNFRIVANLLQATDAPAAAAAIIHVGDARHESLRFVARANKQRR